MNLVYGALLLHSAGKEVNEENVKKVAEATGEKIEEAQVKALVAALEGVNINDVISKAAMPVAAPVAVAEKKEEKKEEKPEEKEKKAESAAEGLSALFG
jgi:large subunit ribosomal protein L12